MAKWSVTIPNFSGGFAYNPRNETIFAGGEPNQASFMDSVNLLSPDYITQGRYGVPLTNGTQAGLVTTLVKGIFADNVIGSGSHYATGGNLVYEIVGSSSVLSDANFPHTINKAVVTGESGEDVVLFQGALYYSYNHSGSAGDIGKFDLSSTFDDDWGSTVPSGAAALTNNSGSTIPHQMVVGGNDVLYIANGRYVASFDGTTFIPQALDFPIGSVVQSIAWNQDALWICVKKSRNSSSIYGWDGTTNSWFVEIPLPAGTIGGCKVIQGNLVFFYHDVGSGTLRIARLNGEYVETLKDTNFGYNAPAYYQISNYYDHIAFIIGGAIFLYGPFSGEIPPRFFDFGHTTHTNTAGGIGIFTSKLIAASTNDSGSYSLETLDNYSTTGSSWNSRLFDITTDAPHSYIDSIRINFYRLSTGARVDWKIYNTEDIVLHSDTISYAKIRVAQQTETTAIYKLNGKVAEGFYIYLDWANGSATNPVKIKNIKVYGHTD